MKKFDNFRAHLRVLSKADQQDLSNEFVIGGVIDKFFIQFELGWKVLKELLVYEGVAAAQSGSPRQIVKEAYKFFACIDEEVWLSMLSQRNNMAHIYDEAAAKDLVQKIIKDYIPAFSQLETSIIERYEGIEDSPLS